MSSNKFEANISDWRILAEKISSMAAQVASLEGELDFSRLTSQGRKIELLLSPSVMLAGAVIYFFSNPLLGIALIALGLLLTILALLYDSRDEKKRREIYVRYAAAKAELEFLKATLSVGAFLGQRRG